MAVELRQSYNSDDSLSPDEDSMDIHDDEEIEICDDLPEDLSTTKRTDHDHVTSTEVMKIPNDSGPLRQNHVINDNSKRIYFSIDNILKPDFGAKENKRVVKNEAPAARQTQGLFPAWVYCTRYSDRPSSGPRVRKIKKREKRPEEKRPRTAFTAEQLAKLKTEFEENRYLSEQRRQNLARTLNLNECQIKIWFQNKRAKMKKSSGQRNSLAIHLMAQGLYNHATVNVVEEEEDSS